MAILKVYQGSFLKGNGDLRTMRFLKLSDTPPELLPPRRAEEITPRKYSDGVELVWDLDKQDFRAFNWNNTVGAVSETIEKIEKLR